MNDHADQAIRIFFLKTWAVDILVKKKFGYYVVELGELE